MQEQHYDLRNATIGVLADTHIPVRATCLDPKIFELFDGVDLILHAGDLVEEFILDELQALAPVEAVAGNMDHGGLRKKLGMDKIIRLPDLSLGIMHGSGAPWSMPDRAFRSFKDTGVQCIVFGHSHEPFLEEREGILLLNPGSVSDPRRGSTPSCAFLYVKNGSLKGKLCPLNE